MANAPVRAFAVLALFVVVANPRMFFYDGTLVVFGLSCLWLGRREMSSRCERWISVAACVGWVASWGAVFHALNPLVGVVGSVVLFAVALDRPLKSAPQAVDTFLIDRHVEPGDAGRAAA